MQRILFFVGPDMCGKTQIAQALSRVIDVPYFKATSEHASYLSGPNQFINQLRYADMRVFDMLKQTGHSVIFDRGYPCEFVYSKAFGRETDERVLALEDESYASLGAKVVICHRSSYEGIQDDLDSNIKESKLQELHNLYQEFAAWTKCDVLNLNVDDEELEREVADVLKFIG